jgi:hypothetical protein
VEIQVPSPSILSVSSVSRYETPDLEGDVLALYTQLEPLYKELHAYIRRKLFQVYGEGTVDLRGPLPAHLLSDMWGRFWNNLYKYVSKKGT